MCLHAESFQSFMTLCDPVECSPPGSSVYGILQARILEWVDMPSSRGLPNPGIELRLPASSALQVDHLLIGVGAIWEALIKY